MAPGRRPQHQQLRGPLVDAHNRILILVVAPLRREGVELQHAWRVQEILPPYWPVRVSLVSVPFARIVRPFVSVTRGETCSAGFFQTNAGCTYTVTLRVVPTVKPSAATQFAFTCAFSWKNPLRDQIRAESERRSDRVGVGKQIVVIPVARAARQTSSPCRFAGSG